MKKIHLTGSWIIKVPRQKVYDIMSDFENMPKYFPKVAKSLKVIERHGNRLKIEVKAKSFGLTFGSRMDTMLIPPRGYISDNESQIGTKGHEEFLMDMVPEGTKINYTYDVELKNPFLRIFGKPLIGWYAMKFWKKAVIDKLKEMLE